MSAVIATVKNTGSTKTELTEVVLTLLDKNGNKIIAMNGIIKPLQPGESTELNIGATADYANGGQISYEIGGMSSNSGLRPLVCLKSDVIMEKQSDGTYKIQ